MTGISKYVSIMLFNAIITATGARKWLTLGEYEMQDLLYWDSNTIIVSLKATKEDPQLQSGLKEISILTGVMKHISSFDGDHLARLDMQTFVCGCSTVGSSDRSNRITPWNLANYTQKYETISLNKFIVKIECLKPPNIVVFHKKELIIINLATKVERIVKLNLLHVPTDDLFPVPGDEKLYSQFCINLKSGKLLEVLTAYESKKAYIQLYEFTPKHSFLPLLP